MAEIEFELKDMNLQLHPAFCQQLRLMILVE